MSLTALVTGATGLLGREILKAFKRAGWLCIGQGFTRAVPPTILKANLEDPKEIERLLDEVKWVQTLLFPLDFEMNTVEPWPFWSLFPTSLLTQYGPISADRRLSSIVCSSMQSCGRSIDSAKIQLTGKTSPRH